MASAAAKPCQGDSSEFYLITGTMSGTTCKGAKKEDANMQQLSIFDEGEDEKAVGCRPLNLGDSYNGKHVYKYDKNVELLESSLKPLKEIICKFNCHLLIVNVPKSCKPRGETDLASKGQSVSNVSINTTLKEEDVNTFQKDKVCYLCRSTSKADSIIKAWQLWNEGGPLDLMEHVLLENYNSDEVLKCIIGGLLCVQEDPDDRPNMSTAVTMLTSDITTLPEPINRPFEIDQAINGPKERLETTYEAAGVCEEVDYRKSFPRWNDQFVVETFDVAPTADSEYYNKIDKSV
ncbi:hypothetical protein Tco_0746139 [Tanacetum coccineum]